MRRKLLEFPSLIAQHALRGAPKPRPQPQPHHHRFVHSPSAPTSASPSPSPSAHLLWNRLSGATGLSLLPRTAADVAAVARTAASRWLAAARGSGSLDLFSLQRRRRASWWQLSSSPFLQGAPWAYWMESPDSAVWMLIGANVAVFMLWRVADPGFMRRHFMISLDNLKSGRLHTLLTNAFSHAESNHLFANMIGLYFFGNNWQIPIEDQNWWQICNSPTILSISLETDVIANVFGPAFLLKLYVGGALTGSVFFLLEKAFLAHRKQDYEGWDTSRVAGLGASAAVNATILLQIFLYPKGLVYLYFLIPVPAALMGAAIIGADLLRLKRHGEVSGSAHLGGALVAALMWARIRKGWI
ncbi:RHOMBOID-like protein 12, mitochondrial isoform X1 [Sorghum bicolor]|uniref:RHOMBOID-like protein 12, mitochondrial isoform X1 n=1 Tax=Sorghum bicolor TaxID=4558 RepID=UPI000B426749|nr:RHOMBOID-like protein 12, mitochondrial isoform X1 [Sorghum bicolor]XP_021312463.1 RHOMBOID-like protein 12, mitochondrial isoform X1 [Sorghum bicolor]XP_021312464.1 RHOMBOID-like protein 12, mitochondrial isoform X1 [Sorghum bicolor]|eukprot:XP_021312462.1 RHOMBOID-like protein 12, mitochondrial isoform X1 [Sorghum bicolor]